MTRPNLTAHFRAKVLERDGFRCGLCGRGIDPKLPHPHPMSASLDHVIPVSRGGGHTVKNLQAAHLKCNMQKGNGQPRSKSPSEADWDAWVERKMRGWNGRER